MTCSSIGGSKDILTIIAEGQSLYYPIIKR